MPVNCEINKYTSTKSNVSSCTHARRVSHFSGSNAWAMALPFIELQGGMMWFKYCSFTGPRTWKTTVFRTQQAANNKLQTLPIRSSMLSTSDFLARRSDLRTSSLRMSRSMSAICFCSDCFAVSSSSSSSCTARSHRNTLSEQQKDTWNWSTTYLRLLRHPIYWFVPYHTAYYSVPKLNTWSKQSTHTHSPSVLFYLL